MTPLDRAVRTICEALDALQVDYAIVGGIANAVWGEPRATIDVDVTVSVEDNQLSKTIRALAARFQSPIDNPEAFVHETRVLPLDTADAVRIDVIFALLPFEVDAIGRARHVALAGRTVSVVTPEDLVLMKIISDRPRDVEDAEAIVRRHRTDIDRTYVEPRVRELAKLLDRQEILDRWIRWTGVDPKHVK